MIYVFYLLIHDKCKMAFKSFESQQKDDYRASIALRSVIIYNTCSYSYIFLLLPGALS